MKTIKTIGFGLLLASLFYLQRSFFELYYLTALRGPQNIFFSIVHLWPERLLYVFFASGFAYYVYIIFALVVTVISFFKNFTEHTRFITFVRISLLVLGVHFVLELTYLKWAYAFFSK